MTLEFWRGATEDVASAVRWYDSQRPGLGGEFLDLLEHLFESIEAAPESFARDASAMDGRHLRQGLLRRFPYKVVFEIKPSGLVIVLAVAHTSRHPDFWKERPV
jgi:plasmid stabilization system protein ParE